MKDDLGTKPVGEQEPKAIGYLQATIAFVATLVLGTLVTSVVGLFVYANVVAAKSRDFEFGIVGVLGLGRSVAAAWVVARRTLEAERSSSAGPAMSLLKKYRRTAAQPGADVQAGQYSIGESYLRELLGRRGA